MRGGHRAAHEGFASEPGSDAPGTPERSNHGPSRRVTSRRRWRHVGLYRRIHMVRHAASPTVPVEPGAGPTPRGGRRPGRLGAALVAAVTGLAVLGVGVARTTGT